MSKGLLLDTVSASNIITEVPPGKIWLFAQREGAANAPKLRGKLSDGSFITFDKTTKTETVTETIYKATEFYQCVSINEEAETWEGQLWSLDEEEGIYSLTETNKSMSYKGFVPVVGGIYSEDTLIAVNNLYTGPDPMPSNDLVFHASLKNAMGTAETGQALTEGSATGASSITYQTFKGVPCAYFSGENYITFSDAEFPQYNTARTVSLWVCIDNTSSIQKLFMYGSGWVDGVYSCAFGIGVIDDKTGFQYGPSSPLLGAFAISSAVWAHIAVVHEDSDATHVYINGVLCSTVNQQMDTRNSIGRIGMGILDSSLNPYTGHLAGVRVYKRALTMDEVAILAGEFKPEA